MKKTYIGHTKRNLVTRLKNHNPSSSNQEIDVTKHMLDNPNHFIDFNNTTVLATANIWRKLLIKENLLIEKFELGLHIDESLIPLYLFIKHFSR